MSFLAVRKDHHNMRLLETDTVCGLCRRHGRDRDRDRHRDRRERSRDRDGRDARQVFRERAGSHPRLDKVQERYGNASR